MTNPEAGGAAAASDRRRGKTGGPQQAWIPSAEERRVLLDSSKKLQQAAAEVGRSVSTVWKHRRTLGMETSARRQWTPEEEALLTDGRLPAVEVAARVACTPNTVRQHRRSLGVVAIPQPAHLKRPWPASEMVFVLDTSLTAADAAAAIGRPVRTVSVRRRALGVAFIGTTKEGKPFAPIRGWTPAEDAVVRSCQRVTAEVVEQLGRTQAAVRARRQTLRGRGKTRPWTPEEDAIALDPRLSLQEAVQRTGRAPNGVSRRRKLLGFAG